MNILILSCNTGEGHNSAAKAVKEYFEQKGDTCEVVDALSFWSPEKSKIISKGHVFIYRRLPELFGAAYRFEERRSPRDSEDFIIYELVTKGCEKLFDWLRNKSFDVILCSHVFSALMVTHLRRKKGLPTPLYFVSTDYTCSPGVGDSELDGYFIPHEALENVFIAGGVKRLKILPLGIPVKHSFYECISKAEAKKKLHIHEDSRVVLLMSGSMGCGPLKDITEILSDKLPDGVKLIVICGNNRRLYKRLTKNGVPYNMRVIGYTTRMPLYMDAADVIMTKPGGLSSTEAAVKALPMVFINAVPGCETRNLDFFVNRGLALTGDTAKDLCRAVLRLLKKPELYEDMHQKLKDNFNFCAVEEIYNYIHGEHDKCK